MPNAIPDGYHSVTPYMIVKGAAKAIELYSKVLGAKQVERMEGPDGTVLHAELLIGNSHIMIGDECESMQQFGPGHFGGTPIQLLVYTEDVDKMFDDAIAAGFKEERPVKDQFYGDRSGTCLDPYGHRWTLATHIEDVSKEEMERRVAAYMSKEGSA